MVYRQRHIALASFTLPKVLQADVQFRNSDLCKGKMNNMGKSFRKQLKSFRISDILGEEVCERKQINNNGEDEDCEENTRNTEEDAHFMVLKSQREDEGKKEDFRRGRSPSREDFYHQAFSHWLPLFASPVKCKEEEEKHYAGKTVPVH